MEYRSTNAGQHIGNDIVAGVNSSHGVQIGGGSTGGYVQTVADDTSASLTILAKGAGPIVIGNSSQAVTINGPVASIGTASTAASFGSTLVTIGATGGQILMAGSTAPFGGMIRFKDSSAAAATPSAFNDTQAGRVYETTQVVTGVNSSHYIVASSTNMPAGVVIAGARAGDTAGDVHVAMVHGSTVAVAATTVTIQLLAFRF